MQPSEGPQISARQGNSECIPCLGYLSGLVRILPCFGDLADILVGSSVQRSFRSGGKLRSLGRSRLILHCNLCKPLYN